MANTQIDITDNGTTTLATAGKYCDRNIDVNVAVRNGTHNIHYEVVNPTAFLGYCKYLTAATADPVLAKVRDKKSLVVLYTIQDPPVSCIKACLAENELGRYPTSHPENRFQAIIIINSDGTISGRDCAYCVNDISEEAQGVGRVYITENGDLRIYCNSSSTHKLPAGTFSIDVIWGDD